MPYKRKTVDKYVLDAWRIAFSTLAIILVINIVNYAYNQPSEVLSPISESKVCAKETKIIKVEKQNIDTWIDKYSKKYTNNLTDASKLKYQLHCLAYYESKHNIVKRCGDSGKSCGIYQFKLATWASFRKIMLKKGLIKEIGDRFNVEQAINTAAWAISDGRIWNWGPTKRGKCL